MPAQPPPSSVSSRPPGWLGVVGILVATLVLPAFLDLGAPQRRAFDQRPLRALEKAKARGVFVGDSMLQTRIDPQALNALAGERWEVLAQPGSSSAIWFLMMKNLVAVQSPPPRTVIIFFRDRQLTLPAHRTDGGYRKTIESYMSDAEPEVEEILRTTTRKRQTWLERLSLAMYPVQRRREAWQEKVQSWALDFVASSREYTGIRARAHEIFSAKNLRADELQDFEAQEGGQSGLDADDHEFGSSVERSFLPHMLQIAQAKGIRLVFFRVKRRPADNGALAGESATAPAYLAALRAYLEKAGATLIDETRDAEVTLDFYGSGDHVKTEMEKRYTEMFWRKVGPLLPPPAQ